VLKVISQQELARNLDPILKALEESGSTLIIKHEEQPIALLLRFDSYVAMLATMDYSGWERWVEDVRAAFPKLQFAPPRRPKSLVPAFIDPGDIGYAPQFGQLGTSAGRRRVAEELASMGIELSDADVGAVYSLVLGLAERKRVLYPEDLRLAADEVLGRAPGKYRLDRLKITSESGVSCTAELEMSIDGKPASAVATGAGPLDAAIKAVQQVTQMSPELEDFSLAAATRGTDALGEAVVTLSQESRVVIGRAVSVDLIEAGVKAYVNALNWLEKRPSQVAELSGRASA
jgi:hypothetical protein